MPPLRDEAPQPIDSASRTTALAPSRAARRAAATPVYPPPITDEVRGVGQRLPAPVGPRRDLGLPEWTRLERGEGVGGVGRHE